MKWRVVKTYGHEQGLSCVFRQWRADSHCKYLHGYALSIALTFEADTLDARHWVIDFGSLSAVRDRLRHMYDHTLLLATDDPAWDDLHRLGLHALGFADVRAVRATGCEAIATDVLEWTSTWLSEQQHAKHVRLVQVDVSEHPGNSATALA